VSLTENATWEQLLTPSGAAGVAYLRDEREGEPLADLLTTELALDEAARLIFHRLPGWQIASDPALGRVLLAAGATPVRHAFTMALQTSVAEESWATPELPGALRIEPVNSAELSPMALLPSQLAAYPPDHPDHETDTGVALGLTVLVMGGDIVGPLLEESAVVFNGDDVVAGLLVNQRPGESPNGGAWVADVWRHPDFPGLGTVLLRRAIALMAARGETALTLTVTNGNPARARYEKLGFTQANEALRVRIPGSLDSDAAATARDFYRESWNLRAQNREEVAEGVILVTDDRYPHSYEHNRLFTDAPIDADALIVLANQAMADVPHRQIEVLGPVSAEQVAQFESQGFETQACVVMPRESLPTDEQLEIADTVHVVTEADLEEWIAQLWRFDLPNAADDVVSNLVTRRALLDVGSTVVRFAAVVDDQVVGSCDLVARGPMAELDAVAVHPDFRQRGLGNDLVRAAISCAQSLGIGRIALTALTDDWPRTWYANLGFTEVDQMYTFTRVADDGSASDVCCR
jgi:GNAT superfamily N-acetyltransferase